MTHQSNPKGNTALIIVLAVAVVVAAALVWYSSASKNTDANTSVNTTTTTNTNAISNTNAAVNENANTNSSSWDTYDSARSDLAIFNRLDPPFSISYPAGTYLSEEVGGLIIGEKPRSSHGPTIEVSRITESLGDDLVQGCKANVPWTNDPGEVVFDEAEIITIGDIETARVSARLPDFNGELDPIFVCVPNGDSFDLITGQPRDASFVSNYFDAVVSTFRLKK